MHFMSYQIRTCQWQLLHVCCELWLRFDLRSNKVSKFLISVATNHCLLIMHVLFVRCQLKNQGRYPPIWDITGRKWLSAHLRHISSFARTLNFTECQYIKLLGKVLYSIPSNQDLITVTNFTSQRDYTRTFSMYSKQINSIYNNVVASPILDNINLVYINPPTYSTLHLTYYSAPPPHKQLAHHQPTFLKKLSALTPQRPHPMPSQSTHLRATCHQQAIFYILSCSLSHFAPIILLLLASMIDPLSCS